jgi:ribosomal protein L39E
MIEDRLKELALYEKKEITYDPVTGDIVLDEFPMLANERLAAKIKTAQAAKEIRAVPEYLLIDNTDQYVDDNPDECRDIAFDLILQRNEAYRKAATAYRRARGKANGEGGIAFFYSDEVKAVSVLSKFEVSR